MATLKLIAGGASDGRLWKATLSDLTWGSFEDFLAEVEDTLLSVDKNKLITQIVSVHQALKRHTCEQAHDLLAVFGCRLMRRYASPEAHKALQNRYAMFDKTIEDEWAERVDELLHLARTTCSEYLLVEACVLSKRNMNQAGLDVSATVKSMSHLPGKDAVKTSDIMPYLWASATRVSAKQPLYLVVR